MVSLKWAKMGDRRLVRDISYQELQAMSLPLVLHFNQTGTQEWKLLARVRREIDRCLPQFLLGKALLPNVLASEAFS